MFKNSRFCNGNKSIAYCFLLWYFLTLNPMRTRYISFLHFGFLFFVSEYIQYPVLVIQTLLLIGYFFISIHKRDKVFSIRWICEDSCMHNVFITNSYLEIISWFKDTSLIIVIIFHLYKCGIIIILKITIFIPTYV